jgi:uncharacterized protein
MRDKGLEIRMRPSRFPVLWFFVLTYAISAMGMCALYFSPVGRLPQAMWGYLTGTGPSLAGLLMIAWQRGLPGIRRIGFQLSPWSVGRAWPIFAVCLLLPLVAAVLTVAIVAMSGAAVPPLSWQRLPAYYYAALVSYGFIGPGITEEIGWRGFALPCLQRRCSALASSLIIGLVWACWHWQGYVYLAPYPAVKTPFPWLEVAAYVPMVMSLSVIFTWVYNSTGGSLFAVVLLHGAVNAQKILFVMDHLPPPPESAQVWTGLPYVLIAAWLVWRYGAANLSSRDVDG